MTFKITVIIISLLGSLYGVILDVVRYRSANNPTPENLSDVYDAETYAKWKKYSAEHCVLDIVSGAASALVSLVLLFTNVYAAFAALFPAGMFWQLFAVVLLETAVNTVFNIIRSYISTMVIEQKYGFNRSTMKTFVSDCIRSLILEFILSSGLAYIIYILHVWMGDMMIVLLVAVLFVVMLTVSFAFPIFSRIGNKFVPLEEGDLKDRLMELLTKHGYKVKAIEVMDASRRTTKLNAYFTGFGKMKTIVLYDNLVNAMTPDEICAVFAHELGHGLHKDVLKLQILNLGNYLIMALVAWIAVSIPALYTEFGFSDINYGFAYVLMGIGLGLVQPLAGMAMNAYSRFAEYRADRQSVKEGYGEVMISALKKLARENFSHLSPSRLNVVMEYNHPPLGSRISAIEEEVGKK